MKRIFLVKKFDGLSVHDYKIFFQEMYIEGYELVFVKRGIIFNYFYFSFDDGRKKTDKTPKIL
jgi:hypothetical protein